MNGAPPIAEAVEIWRNLHPNDAERLDLQRRGLVEPGGMDQLRPLCIECGQSVAE